MIFGPVCSNSQQEKSGDLHVVSNINVGQLPMVYCLLVQVHIWYKASCDDLYTFLSMLIRPSKHEHMFNERENKLTVYWGGFNVFIIDVIMSTLNEFLMPHCIIFIFLCFIQNGNNTKTWNICFFLVFFFLLDYLFNSHWQRVMVYTV